MFVYLMGRVRDGLLLLLVMSFSIYVLIGLMPGDPIDLMVAGNPNLTAADADRLKALYGLDRPLLARYWSWLGAAVEGDFGYSRLTGAPALDVLLERLVNTLLLMSVAFGVSVTLALLVGTLAALRPHGWIDAVVSLGCFVGISVPPFWLALLLIMLFAVSLGWFPAGGLPPAGVWEDPGATLAHLALPVTTLVLASVGDYTRFVRASVAETLRQDFVRTARAKGARTGRVVLRHVLRNALIPVVTVLALQFGQLFSGALVTETMFSWLGMGKTIYDAIMGNDYNLALIGLLLATSLILLANIMADIAYAWLDPRIHHR